MAKIKKLPTLKVVKAQGGGFLVMNGKKHVHVKPFKTKEGAEFFKRNCERNMTVIAQDYFHNIRDYARISAEITELSAKVASDWLQNARERFNLVASAQVVPEHMENFANSSADFKKLEKIAAILGTTFNE